MVKFEKGKIYATRSICDHNCVFSFKIIKRTDKSVYIQERDGTIARKGLTVYNGVEQFFPYGRYSMAAIISADSPDWR